tara:strand:+ start:87 stop:689 length:603 start_codon:yes stop_codon:yes gene_type:complete
MKKTPQHFKRENVKKLFDKVLGDSKVKLAPLSINIFESFKDDFTTVDLTYTETCQQSTKVCSLAEVKAKGFVDCLFVGLHDEYIKTYSSLEKIKLVNIEVKPLMKKSTERGSDARTSVAIKVEVKDHGISEFENESRSMIHSSFVSSLEAFQFYINCEKTFKKIKSFLEDAQSRNRGDIIQSCLTDLSTLTEVNTYAKGE